ncbi:MAG TPA: hypothetical protein VFN55_01815 [Solirubrobacteraceae bacterium]|nr:hypothetical protein [Solirubrobacteraceae bacterium]
MSASRGARAVVLLVALGTLAGAPGVSARPAGRTAAAPALHTISDVAGRRYCEILLVRKLARGLTAQVFNTFTLNDCPPARWRAVDTHAVARATGAVLAVRNGPRYWLMDSIAKLTSGPEVRRTLGGIPMLEQATVPLTGLSTAPFTVHTVNRYTVFAWRRGDTVYELDGPGGSRWVMQSYSRQIDARLSHSDLPHLGPRIGLPAGWSYHARRLARPLRVVTIDRAAQVTQDALDDTYSRIR